MIIIFFRTFSIYFLYLNFISGKSSGKEKIKKKENPQKYMSRIPSVFEKRLKDYLLDLKSQKKKIIEYGISSYYHEKFQGRRTATGDIFHQNLWTGAHQTLPIPSIVLVCYLEEGSIMGIIILLNDRGPFVNKRILDLSSRAGAVVGLKKKGCKKVGVVFLLKETERLHYLNKMKKFYIPPYLGKLNRKQIEQLLKDNYIIIN